MKFFKFMSRWCRVGVGLVVGVLAVEAKELVNINKAGVAVQGYDVVAFFSVSAAVKGAPDWTAEDRGATYWFSSRENRDAFIKEPGKYAPAFGGFCAWAISEKKTTAPVDVATWQIVEGRLILNYDADIKAKFDRAALRHLKQADLNWPGVVEKKGK